MIFNECFQPDKQFCHYNAYVRFHYVDVRLTKQKQYVGPITINTYLFLNQLNTIELLLENYFNVASKIGMKYPELEDLRHDIIESVDFTNRLVDKILTRGQTLRGSTINYNKELFNAALFSKNYPEDVDRIFNILIDGITSRTDDLNDFTDFRDAMKSIVTERNGDIMHRTAAQLQELRADNVLYKGRNIADLIIDFIQTKYELIDISDVYTFWRRFYKNVYLPVSKMVVERDFYTSLNAFEKYTQNKMTQNTTILVHSDALIMDAYILACMFRKFKTPRKGRKPHTPSDLVITYTGSVHTRNYSQFFYQYLNIRPIDYQDNPDKDTQEPRVTNRCLKNSNFSTYFNLS